MRWIPFLLVFWLQACQYGLDMRDIPLDSLFHDNTSKVWVISSAQRNGKEVVNSDYRFMEVVVFYYSGNMLISPLNKLGNSEPTRGKFTISKKKVDFNFADGTVQNYEVLSAEENKVVLTSKDLEITLVPFPEL